MNEKVPFALVCVAVLAFACGPRGRNSESATTNRAATTVARNNSNNSADPLAPTLDISVDDEVRFAFSVTNATNKKLEVLFPSGRTHDVVVVDSLGREVWRWSDGRLFTQTVQARVIRASDSMAFTEEWKDARPGSYTAIATLASNNFPVEHRTSFVVR